MSRTVVGNLKDADPLLLHVMLTLAAIIQAVTFTELIQSPQFEHLHFSLGLEDLLRLAQVVMMLQVVVVVWFAQVVNFSGYQLWPRRLFGYLDSFFAFLIGAIEAKLVHLLDEPRLWCLWFSFFFFFILLAWLDFYRKMKHRQSTTRRPLFGTRFVRFKWVNVASAGVSGICFLAFAYRFRFVDVRSKLALFVFANVIGVCFMLAVKQEWEDLKQVSVPDHRPGSHGSPPDEDA